MKRLQRWIVPILLVFSAIFFLAQYLSSNPQVSQWSYSDLISHAQAGQVKSISISSSSGVATDTAGHKYNVSLPPDQSVTMADELKAAGVDVQFQSTGDLVSILIGFLPNLLFLLVIGGLFYWSYRSVQRGQGQAMSFGRSKPRLVSPERSTVTFADVAGVEEARTELEEVVEFLKTPERFRALGARIPRGVLMVGPPGSGKTLLARAIAGEAGVPFFSISGSEFVEMFVGVGASRVRDLFEQAKKAAPAVIFIDELDAVGRHRFAGVGGGHDEREQTLNQLLVELDGFEQNQGIILIAATNRPDVIDPALLRPGRFDRQIRVPLPDLKGREEILKVHAKIVKMSANADLSVVARRTPGFSGADLANVINEAALLASRKDKEGVELADLEEAIERVISGPQRKVKLMSDKERRVIAYHESGHTLVAKLLPGTDPVHKVSIISRGMALGYTLQLPIDDKYLTSKVDIINRLAILFGGRAAEEVAFQEVWTGATDDISKATAYATRMVTEFGMSDKVGPLALKKPDQEIFLGRGMSEQTPYSERTAQLVDEEVKRLITEAQATARSLLSANKKILDDLAAKLFDREVLNGEEIDAILTAARA